MHQHFFADVYGKLQWSRWQLSSADVNFMVDVKLRNKTNETRNKTKWALNWQKTFALLALSRFWLRG